MTRVFVVGLLLMGLGCAWQWCWQCEQTYLEAPWAGDVPLAPTSVELQYREEKTGQREQDEHADPKASGDHQDEGKGAPDH